METNEFNPYRKRLIRKGIVSGEMRGYVYFTLPLFDEYVVANYQNMELADDSYNKNKIQTEKERKRWNQK